MTTLIQKKTILIGTTAINRSLLHKDNIPEWYNYINSVDKNIYELHWFINIDYIEKLEESVEITKQIFQSIITEIPLTIVEKIPQDDTGNFLNACKRVSNNIEQYVADKHLNIEDVIIIWLEDDWKLNLQNIPIQELIENYLADLTHINLSFIRPNYIHALAPSIINYKLWSQIELHAWKNRQEHIDPEHCAGKHFLQNFGKYDNICNITVINQHKTVDKKFCNKITQLPSSFYTYDVLKDVQFKNNKYVEKQVIKQFIQNKITFIRITTSSCLDGVKYGRNFMKQYNIIKKGIQTKDVIDFYI